MRLNPINTEFHVHIESFNSPFKVGSSGTINDFFKVWNKRCLSFKNDIEVCNLIYSVIKYFRRNNLQYLELLFCPTGFESDGGQTKDYYKFWHRTIKENGLEKRIKLILDFPFQSNVNEHKLSILNANNYFGKANLISGISFGGKEYVGFLNSMKYIIDFLKDSELILISHLGETIHSEKNLYQFIELGLLKRISHFTQFLKNDSCLDVIKENNVCIDLCPIANLKMGLINGNEELRMGKLLNLQIPFTLNSDNPDIFQNSFRSIIESVNDEKISKYLRTKSIYKYSSSFQSS